MSLLKEAVEMLVLDERTYDQEGVEVIAPTRHKTAAALAAQFIKMAEQQSGGGTAKGAELLAKKFAAEFHRAMVAEIDDQVKMKNMKSYHEYGEAGTFHRKA